MGYHLQCWFDALTREQENHDKLFVNSHGKMTEYESPAHKMRADVHFPVTLAVRFGEDMPQIYQHFVLNISKGGVYIITDRPLQEGSIVIMHFYIPPQEKLLGEFKGEVIAVKQKNLCPEGMHVKFFDVSAENMQRLDDFLEGKRSLLNISA